jgi:ATP-dependent 26S proteasome regulatory subunit
MEDTFRNIKCMLNANFPLLYLVTSEYGRVTQKLRKIAFEEDYQFHTWDCVDHLKTHKKNQNNRLEEVVPHVESDSTEDCESLINYLYEGLAKTEDNSKEIFVVEDFHKYFDREKIVVGLRKLSLEMKDLNKHIIFLSPSYQLPEEIEKYVTVVSIPLPDRKDLEIRLRSIYKGELDEDLKKYIIDAALGLTDTEAELAFRLANEMVGLNTREAVQIIANEKEQIIKKSGILDYVQVNLDMKKNVGGLDDLKAWLKQRSKAFERKAKEFGLQEPKGIMLLGVPGCGKSLTAKCVATEWKQPLLRLDVGKVFQAEVGSSENNIRRAIATAEAVAPCVLWIDEIEKGLNVGGERDGGTNSRVFSTILTWMQEKTKPVFVVATANDISQLPPEFLRKGRFDEIFFVDLPTEEERKEILRIHLQKNNQTGIQDLDDIAKATVLYNGAELEEIVKESMFLAYIDNPNNPNISIAHLEEARSHIIPLAKTMSEKIRGLRGWADTRARRASRTKNNETLPDQQATVKQTKREKAEDTFG